VPQGEAGAQLPHAGGVVLEVVVVGGCVGHGPQFVIAVW